MIQHKSIYWFYPGNENDLNTKPWKGEKFKTQDYAWHVIKDHHNKNSKSSKYKLKYNDIIKLGRVRFRMKKLMNRPKEQRVEEELKKMNVGDFLPNYAGPSKEQQNAHPDKDQEYTCRICLQHN